jgi:hypothetical protein
MLFAYIDTTDCYGTLVEIGMAHAMGKPIYITFAHKLLLEIREYWFAVSCAINTDVCKTSEQLVQSFIGFLEQETSYRRLPETRPDK